MTTQVPEASGRVKIIKVPAGESPVWVRRAWVGLTLPCQPISGEVANAIGVITREPVTPRDCVLVSQEDAFEVLRTERPDAYEWWKAHGYPKEKPVTLCFGTDEVEVISGVKRQRIIEVPDEAMGDPNR